MIYEKAQEKVLIDGVPVSNTINTGKPVAVHSLQRFPMRRGTSPRVLKAAKRLMKEYQADLDYLRDR